VVRPTLVLALLVSVIFAGCRERWEAGLIYHPTPQLHTDPSSVGLPYRDVAFTAADGVRLHGWLIPGRVKTTLLYSHGNAGNIADRVSIARLLHDQLGVGVFMYDYRGFGKSEGAPTETGLVQDAHAAREAALRGGVDAENLAYLGRSLGAAVTVELALAHPARAVVLESPFASVRAMANTVLPGVGYVFRTRWDSLTRIRGLRSPLLVVHSDADEVVPYAQGQAVFAAAPQPKMFFTIHGRRHYDLEAGWSDYWATWRRFLEASGLPTTGGKA
jgi:fermentation-respiration switch protein FrsA (DUF1100 family)